MEHVLYEKLEEITLALEKIIHKDEIIRPIGETITGEWFYIIYNESKDIYGISYGFDANVSNVAILTNSLRKMGFNIEILSCHYISVLEKDKNGKKVYYGQEGYDKMFKELNKVFNQQRDKDLLAKYVLQTSQYGGIQ